MKLSALGAADLRLHEGFVDHWYKDVTGTGTIGIGFTKASSAFQKWWQTHKPTAPLGPGATMTRAQADDALISVADEEYGAAVNHFLGHDVAQHIFDAALSVVFNAGAGALTDRWATALKAGDYAEAAALLTVTRVTSKGKRLAGLVSRRADEARLLSKGIYATTGAATLPTDDAMSDGILIRGERGEAVLKLQRDLAKAGFDPGKPDGIFGFGTEAAVLAFQRDRKLTVDGKAGPKTLAAL